MRSIKILQGECIFYRVKGKIFINLKQSRRSEIIKSFSKNIRVFSVWKLSDTMVDAFLKSLSWRFHPFLPPKNDFTRLFDRSSISPRFNQISSSRYPRFLNLKKFRSMGRILQILNTIIRKLLIWIELQIWFGTNLIRAARVFRKRWRRGRQKEGIGRICKVAFAPSKTNYADLPRVGNVFPPEIGRWSNGNDFLPRHLVPTGACECVQRVSYFYVLLRIRLGSQHCSTVRLPVEVKFPHDTGKEWIGKFVHQPSATFPFNAKAFSLFPSFL